MLDSHTLANLLVMKIVILIEIIVINKIHYRFEPSYHLVEFVIVWPFCSVSSLFPCWPCSFMMVAHSVMVISYDYRNIRSWSRYWCRACYKLATQGTIFFFTFICHLRRKQKIDPYINVTKTHKSEVNIKLCRTWCTCVPVYCIYCHTCTYICVQDLYRHVSTIA